MNRNIRQTLFPLLAALIWGTAFSAQSVATAYVGPLTFNAARSLVAFLFLLALDPIVSRLSPGRKTMFQLDAGERRVLLVGGAACGLALALAANMQQLGIAGTSAGKAGFITAMYIVIVPVLGLFQKKRPTPLLWASVAIAVAGLYFLCVNEGFRIERSDFYVLICAFLFSLHILVIDRFSAAVDGIQLSCVQFLVAAVLSGAGMFALEQPSFQALSQCLLPVLYAGFFSSGVGYTLQILAQKDANPTVVSLLLSLESVFAALGGAVLLHERMGSREIVGCVLMLAAVLLAQLPAASGSPRSGAPSRE